MSRCLVKNIQRFHRYKWWNAFFKQGSLAWQPLGLTLRISSEMILLTAVSFWLFAPMLANDITAQLCPKINAINVIFWKCNSFQLQSSLFSVGIRWAPLLFLFFVHHCTPLRSSCWRGKIKLISLAQQLIEWYVHTLIGTFMQISFAVWSWL